MYFTENRYDRSIESMMKGIPNFHPRGSGIVVTGRFEYTADMCDCRLCERYGGKLRGCKVPRCVCLEERIAVGVASLKEVMKETMSEIKHSGFLRRLRKYIKESEFIVMKTGVHPMKVHLKLFFKWGIEFYDEHPYTVPENGNRKVQYAEKKEIQEGIMEKYHPESVFDEPPVSEKANRGGKPHGNQQQNIFDEVQPPNEKERRKKRGGASETPEQTMIPPNEQVGTDGSP